MSIKLLYNSWQAKRRLVPERKFKAALWKKLSTAWGERYQRGYFWYQTVWFRYSVAALIGVVVLGSFGTSAYAYYSPEVTEGTLLYPVKQRLEQAEELTKRTPEAKAEFYLKKIQRREAERLVMQKQGRRLERVEEQIAKTEGQLEKATQLLEKVPVKNSQLRERVQERLEKRKEVLEKRKVKTEDKEVRLQEKKERRESLLNKINSSSVPALRRGGRNGNLKKLNNP